jgi:hypothetical protein
MCLRVRALVAVIIIEFLPPCYYAKNEECYHIADAIVGFAGLYVTFATNIIAVVVAYIVFTRKAVQLREAMRYITAAMLIVSAAVTIVQYFYRHVYLYYWIRIGSIGFNIIVCTLLLMEMRTRYAIKFDPVRALTHRMMFYPVVQVRMSVTRGMIVQIYRYADTRYVYI